MDTPNQHDGHSNKNPKSEQDFSSDLGCKLQHVRELVNNLKGDSWDADPTSLTDILELIDDIEGSDAFQSIRNFRTGMETLDLRSCLDEFFDLMETKRIEALRSNKGAIILFKSTDLNDAVKILIERLENHEHSVDITQSRKTDPTE